MSLHNDPCPGCNHPLGHHAIEMGCTDGWNWDFQGIAASIGCTCPLALAEQHDPPSERDF